MSALRQADDFRQIHAFLAFVSVLYFEEWRIAFQCKGLLTNTRQN
jgi:hypothetical protein